MNSNWTRDVWAGTADTEEWKQWPAVKARFPVEAGKIPWEQYSHYASLVRDLPCCHDKEHGAHACLESHCNGSLRCIYIPHGNSSPHASPDLYVCVLSVPRHTVSHSDVRPKTVSSHRHMDLTAFGPMLAAAIPA